MRWIWICFVLNCGSRFVDGWSDQTKWDSVCESTRKKSLSWMDIVINDLCSIRSEIMTWVGSYNWLLYHSWHHSCIKGRCGRYILELWPTNRKCDWQIIRWSVLITWWVLSLAWMTYYYDYKLLERSFVVCERAQRGSEPWCRWHGSAQTAGVGVRHGESAMVEDLLKGS